MNQFKALLEKQKQDKQDKEEQEKQQSDDEAKSIKTEFKESSPVDDEYDRDYANNNDDRRKSGDRNQR